MQEFPLNVSSIYEIIQLVLHPNLPKLVSLLIAFVSGLIAVIILLNILPMKHKEIFKRVVSYCSLLGILLGILLPLEENLGLWVAAFTSLIFAFLSLYYHLLRTRIALLPLVRRFWISRVTMRNLFLYFQVTTGLIGIISTIMLMVVPLFFPLTPGAMVPVTFSCLSVLSSLLQFTIRTPSYHTLYALTYHFLLESRRLKDAKVYLDYRDFDGIIRETHHTKHDLMDTLEMLVRGGMALRSVSGARFTINKDGIELMEFGWRETNIRVIKECDKIGDLLEFLKDRIKTIDISKSKAVRELIEELAEIREMIDGMVDRYGLLLNKEWYERVMEDLDKMENAIKGLA